MSEQGLVDNQKVLDKLNEWRTPDYKAPKIEEPQVGYKFNVKATDSSYRNNVVEFNNELNVYIPHHVHTHGPFLRFEKDGQARYTKYIPAAGKYTLKYTYVMSKYSKGAEFTLRSVKDNKVLAQGKFDRLGRQTIEQTVELPKGDLEFEILLKGGEHIFLKNVEFTYKQTAEDVDRESFNGRVDKFNDALNLLSDDDNRSNNNTKDKISDLFSQSDVLINYYNEFMNKEYSEEFKQEMTEIVKNKVFKEMPNIISEATKKAYTNTFPNFNNGDNVDLFKLQGYFDVLRSTEVAEDLIAKLNNGIQGIDENTIKDCKKIYDENIIGFHNNALRILSKNSDSSWVLKTIKSKMDELKTDEKLKDYRDYLNSSITTSKEILKKYYNLDENHSIMKEIDKLRGDLNAL